jgi:RNA recognition motif-containing protein
MQRLYVGNLPYSTTEQDLKNLFGQHGELKDVKIVIDRETQRSKGFGFVEFVRPEDAEAALTEDGQDFGGRALRVSEALAKDRNGGGRSGGGNGGNRPPPRQDDRGGRNDRGGGGGGRKRQRQRDRD